MSTGCYAGLIFFAAAAAAVTVTEKPAADGPAQAGRKLTSAQRQQRIDVVQGAFGASHDGWSADEVVIDDARNEQFLKDCRAALPETDDFDFNWTLLNLRKAGALRVRATRRVPYASDDEYVHAAEIAARLVQDRYRTSIDRVLADPTRRREFDRAASGIAPSVALVELRRAALRLRKARKLQPELVVRVADWGRQITTLTAGEVLQEPAAVPGHPGVYLFRDATGYLYIGEAANLKQRVTQHLDHSDRKSLAQYLWKNRGPDLTIELHTFDPDSRAKEKSVRRAYESELIRSRKPRLNIAP